VSRDSGSLREEVIELPGSHSTRVRAAVVPPPASIVGFEIVTYPNQVPFAAAITADPGSYWRSRNCRTNGDTGTPRFDESTWIGDGVVAPFRATCFNTKDTSGNVLCRGYFRPGNRAQNKIANEFPYSQLVYGTCTGVFRNNPAASPPVIPAVPEDQYPGWFDGNSYITLDHGSYSPLFDIPLGNNPCTTLAFVRFPSTALNRNNPIYSNLNLTLGQGMSLSIGNYPPGTTTYQNVPMFQVSTAAGLAALIDSMGRGISISPDMWYLIAGVKDIVFNKLWIYLFGPGGLALNSWVPHVQYVSNGANNRCIGRDEATTTNAMGHIEVFALFAYALTQPQLQNLYNVGINGGA